MAKVPIRAPFLAHKILAHKMPFRKAGWFWRRVLQHFGFYAITMPWGLVYVLDWMFESRPLRKHELVHLRQIQRDGPVIFSIRYLYFCARVGYWNNPYEVEAYRSATPRT